MNDDEIDAILHEKKLRRARPKGASAPVEAPEAGTPLAELQQKHGVAPQNAEPDDDLSVVLAEGPDSKGPRALVVSKRRRGIVGERG